MATFGLLVQRNKYILGMFGFTARPTFLLLISEISDFGQNARTSKCFQFFTQAAFKKDAIISWLARNK